MILLRCAGGTPSGFQSYYEKRIVSATHVARIIDIALLMLKKCIEMDDGPDNLLGNTNEYITYMKIHNIYDLFVVSSLAFGCLVLFVLCWYCFGIVLGSGVNFLENTFFETVGSLKDTKHRFYLHKRIVLDWNGGAPNSPERFWVQYRLWVSCMSVDSPNPPSILLEPSLSLSKPSPNPGQYPLTIP